MVNVTVLWFSLKPHCFVLCSENRSYKGCNKYTIILDILSQLCLVDSSYNIDCENFKGGWEKQILEFLSGVFFSPIICLWKNEDCTLERCRMWKSPGAQKNVFQCYVMKSDGWKWPAKVISFPWTTNQLFLISLWIMILSR